MSKRFTDTDKWKKPFIRGLQGAYKLLWFYILDDCDHAGIWHVDMDVAAIRIGEPIGLESAIPTFEKHIVIFDNGEKWFIPDFIEFQYGDLNPANRVHNSVLKQLSKYNIDPIKGCLSPLQGVKDKDKDKEKDKDKGKETRKESFKNKTLEHLEKYDAIMINEFFEYWTESNTGSNVLRFEMNKNQPFDIGRRLVTWKKNQKTFIPQQKTDTHKLGEQDYTKGL